MRLELFGLGMSPLHRAGLAGLYMTLDAFSKSRLRIPGLEWSLSPSGVALEWLDEKPGSAFRNLISKSFQIDDNGFFHFPGLETEGPLSIEHKHLLYDALKHTFLQFGPNRKTGAKTALSYQINDQFILDEGFSPILSYRHHESADIFLSNDQFRDSIKLSGWLFPGGTVRHVGSGATDLEEPSDRALCLLFSPVGCFYFKIQSKTQGRKTRAALIVPIINDLEAYVETRRIMYGQDVSSLTASGSSDAALRFLVAVRAAHLAGRISTLTESDVQCQTVSFGIVGWNEKQKVRTMVQTVDAKTLKYLDNYEIAASIFKNKWQRIKQKTNRKGEIEAPSRDFVKTYAAREIIAGNIARGSPFFHGFSDYMTNKETREQLLYERKELNEMVEKAVFDDENQRILISACHEAWRRRLGQLGDRSRSESTDFNSLANREFERWRVSLARCKNASSLRETLVDFWSRTGPLPALQNRWQDILSLLDDPQWRLAKDLALLALASYKPANKEEEAALAGDSDQKGEEL